MSNPCKILRQPPEFQSDTRKAIYKDKPVLTWVAKVNEDGIARKCWKGA